MIEHSQAEKSWKARWVHLSDGPGGAQGFSKIVCSKETQEPRYFLKILKSQRDPVRRKRMYREVAAYRTLDHWGVPRLEDTNAEMWDLMDYELYLVAELIEGPTLQKLISDQGPLESRAAVKLILGLLEIIEHCHANDVLHRDIKADNIVLRADRQNDPVLVDFGLSFNQEDEDSEVTSIGEELGNRRLRLPEFAPGSHNKRDRRSDVTFCVGILLYVLTGIHAEPLRNEKSQMPHQRDDVRMILHTRVEEPVLKRLLSLFDRGFQEHLDLRWQTAGELRSKLSGIVLAPSQQEPTMDEQWKEIQDHFGQPHIQEDADVTRRLLDPLRRASKAANRISERMKHQLSAGAAGPTRQPDSELALVQIFFSRPGKTHKSPTKIEFIAELVGSEIVVSYSHDKGQGFIYRTSSAAPTYDGDFDQELERVLIEHVRNLIEANLV